MKAGTFRILMLVSLGLLAAEIATGMPLAVPPQPPTAGFSPEATSGAVISFAWMTLFVAGFIGMYRFRSWGRLVSLAAALLVPAAALVQMLVFDNFNPSTGEPVISATLQTLAELTWGGVLAIAYFSPLSARFARRSAVGPMPLPGAS